MRQRCTILVADDDKYIREDLKDVLADTGYEVLFAATAAETWQITQEMRPALVLLDLKFPDCSDLSLLQRIKRETPDVEVIMLTSQTENVPQIVAAIKLGAFDYVPKPFISEELKNRIERALDLQQLRKSQQRLLTELQGQNGVEALVGGSAVIQSTRETIKRLADMDGCVLIQGETGTGKELAARALHYNGVRRDRPFIAVNCASLPEALLDSVLFGHRKGSFTGAIESSKGKFEMVEDGTLFLDEIGDMPQSQQTSLLRVLEYRRFTPLGETQERECRARFVFATNRNLRESVKEGRFRADLFYRINVAPVVLPALKSRPEDIPMLVEHFNQRLGAEMGRRSVRVHPDVLALFQQYDWPGNVRELKHILEGALMLGNPTQDEIQLGEMPAELLAFTIKKSSGSDLSAKDLREREALIDALKECAGNQTLVGKILGVHRNTIRAKMRYYGLGGLGQGDDSR